MFKIANVCIQLNNLESQHTSSRLELFEVADIFNIDAVYQVQYVEDFFKLDTSSVIYVANQFAVIRKDCRKLYCYMQENCIYAVLEEISESQFTLYINRPFFAGEVHPYFLPSMLGLERLLIKKSAFVLHSSYIEKDGAGIVFTAPSGGGKSTQAELWRAYQDARILNGDKSIIGKDESGMWNVYGIPFSGSSEYCVNESNPLRAIVILQKSPVNMLYRVDLDGFRTVFSQVTVNPWDVSFSEQIMDLVMAVCSEVPVYVYACTKEPEAAEKLAEYFRKDGVFDGIRE